jgi:phosphoglycolate phosphatase-like HAD superfamily hydrolase
VEAIQKVLKLWGTAPQETLYIGDSPSDITETRECGVPIVSAAWAETANAEKLGALQPDWLFSDLTEFAGFMKRLIRNPDSLSM